MKEVREMMKVEKAGNFEKTLKGVRSKIDKLGARRLHHLKEKGIGTWLAATPNNMCATVLYRQLGSEMNFATDTVWIF